MYHGVAGPHHVDILVQPVADGAEELLVGPAAVVAGGAHDELLVHIRMLADEMLQNVVAELHLPLRLADFAEGIIHQHTEIADADGIHLFQLGAEGIQLGAAFILLPVHGVGGVDGPHEAHAVLAGAAHQGGQLVCLALRVGLVAAFAVVQGVVLRGVDVEVHLVAAVETELALAGLKAPGYAVVSFHCAAVGQVRPVHHGAHGDIPQLHHAADIQVGEGVPVGILRAGHIHQHLAEGLLGVEPAGVVIVQHGHVPLRGHVDGVAAGDIRQPVPEPAAALRGAVLNGELVDRGTLLGEVLVLRGGIDGGHGGGWGMGHQAGQQQGGAYQVAFHKLRMRGRSSLKWFRRYSGFRAVQAAASAGAVQAQAALMMRTPTLWHREISLGASPT